MTNNIEYAAGVRQIPISKQEEQKERIRELVDDVQDQDPMYECAARRSGHDGAVPMMEALAMIPRGRKDAVSKRKFCRKYGIEVRAMDDWISKAGQFKIWICEQRGKIWLADNENDMLRIFDQEKHGITYR